MINITLDELPAYIEKLQYENAALGSLAAAQLRVAEAEIERLRGELEAKAEKIRSGAWRDEKIAKQEAEIERLRHDYAELADRSVAAAKNAVVPYQAEIERLRRQLESEAYSTEEAINKRDAEIGRLRRQLLNVLDMAGDAPIEQLRGEMRELMAELGE